MTEHKLGEQELTLTSAEDQEQELRVVVSDQDPVCCCPAPNMTEYKLVVVGGQSLILYIFSMIRVLLEFDHLSQQRYS